MTSLITRCPKCATAFNVTEAHLNTANGAVRCGSCLSVFNGRENLASMPKIAPVNTLLDDDDDILISDDFIIDEDSVHDHSDKDIPTPSYIKNLLQPTFNDDDDDDESWALKLLEEEGHDADFMVNDDAIDIPAPSNKNTPPKPHFSDTDNTIKIESTKGPSSDVELHIPSHDTNAITEPSLEPQAVEHKTDSNTDNTDNTDNIETETSADSPQQNLDVVDTPEALTHIEPANSDAVNEAVSNITNEAVSDVANENPSETIEVSAENAPAKDDDSNATPTEITAEQAEPEETKIEVEDIDLKGTTDDIATSDNATSSPTETTQTSEITSQEEAISTAETEATNAPNNASPAPDNTEQTTPASLKAQAYANSKAQEDAPEAEIDEQALAELTEELKQANIEMIDMDSQRVPNTGANTNHSLLHSIEAETLEFSYTSTGSRWKTRALWAALAGLAACALFVQVAWMKFDQFSVQQPYRQYYGIACQYLDCSLPQLRDLSKIRTTNLLVRQHPSTEGALLVDVVIQNLANFEQPFPKLVMVFSNIKEKVVASRAFEPSEYLGGDLLGATLMPQQKAIHLSLELVDPGNGAESYKIMIAP